MPDYQPPFTITSKILKQVAVISEKVGRLSVQAETEQALRLRRINRIRTIQGSLAIEGNTLSQQQITAILEGKRVIAPPREIQEVQNATLAYNYLSHWQAHNEQDLLAAHRTLMTSLIEDAGHYRQGGVGVMSGDQVLHMAPPAGRVSVLMMQLLEWLKNTDEHPLVASSIFHYEFEFIHPFADGNGRMGRLWQTLILSQWNPLFASIPVESLVHQHQADYYAALQVSTDQTDSAPMIEFMLQMVASAIDSLATPQVTPQLTPQVKQLLTIIKGEMTRAELQNLLDLSDRKSFRERYIVPALQAGLIEMTIPDKPSSRLQKYRLTNNGQLMT